MDTIDNKLRDSVFEQKKNLFKKIKNFELNFFQTSIWENDLYKIFCKIFSENLKNSEKIQKFLGDYASTINAKEVFLFNKKSSLFISSYSAKEKEDEKKIEKICVSMKKMNNKLKKSEKYLKEMTLKNKMNTIYISEFNDFCYIVVVLSNNNKQLELAKLNGYIGKKLLEEYKLK